MIALEGPLRNYLIPDEHTLLGDLLKEKHTPATEAFRERYGTEKPQEADIARFLRDYNPTGITDTTRKKMLEEADDKKWAGAMVYNGDFAAAKFLIEHGLFTRDGLDFWMHNAYTEKIEWVNLALENGADPQTGFQCALELHHSNMAERLLEEAHKRGQRLYVFKGDLLALGKDVKSPVSLVAASKVRRSMERKLATIDVLVRYGYDYEEAIPFASDEETREKLSSYRV